MDARNNTTHPEVFGPVVLFVYANAMSNEQAKSRTVLACLKSG